MIPTAVVLLAAVAGFLGNALLTDTRNTAVTFAVILAGLPVYWLTFGRRRG